MDAITVVGWTCTLLGAGVLGTSAWRHAALSEPGRAIARQRRGVDVLLALAWGGLWAGGVGLLTGFAWSRWALGAGVLVVVAWAVFSAAARIHVAFTMGEIVPVNRTAAVVGNLGPALVVAALAAWLLRWLVDPALASALR
jgi:hypothetical protein